MDAIDQSEPHPLGPHPLAPSYRLVNTIGLSSERVQVMKASFFEDEEPKMVKPHPQFRPVGPVMRPHPQPLGQSFTTTQQSSNMPEIIKPRPQVPRPEPEVWDHSSHSDTHHTVLAQPHTYSVQYNPRSHTAPLAQPQTLVPKHTLDNLTPLNGSWSLNRMGLFKDMGHFIGRSFRVGWGTNWSFVHSGEGVSLEAVNWTRQPPSIFNRSIQGGVVSGEDKGLKIRAVAEQLDASPWMKIADQEKKKVV